MINNGKAKISEDDNSLTISIPSYKNYFILIFTTMWLGGWFFGLKAALGDFINISSLSGFMLFWTLGWTAGGIFLIISLCWGYFGKEELHIGRDSILFSKHVFNVGMKAELDKSEVSKAEYNNVQVNIFSNGNKFSIWGFGPGKIKFNYGMKTYSFGLAVDEAEAKHIISIINEKI